MANPILKQKIEKGEIIFVAGVWDELSAIIFEKAGFEALKLGSGQMSASFGLPDFGLLTPKDFQDKIFGITDRTEAPLLVDFESGFGGVIAAVHWARQFERAGATGIHLDDYGEVDKCPWLPPYLPTLEKAESIADKVKAICDTRKSETFLVIARTGAPFSSAFKSAEEALEEGIKRCQMWKEAGADIIWGRAYSEEGLKRFRDTIRGPLCTQIGLKQERHGKSSASHHFTTQQLYDMGYQIMFTGTSLIPVAIKAMMDSAREFRATGDPEVLRAKTMKFEEWNDLVGLNRHMDVRKKYDRSL